jgi:hypothetical protein
VRTPNAFIGLYWPGKAVKGTGYGKLGNLALLGGSAGEVVGLVKIGARANGHVLVGKEQGMMRRGQKECAIRARLEREAQQQSHPVSGFLWSSPGWNRVGNKTTLRARGQQVEIEPVYAPSARERLKR